MSATLNNATVWVGDVAQYASRDHGISYGKVEAFFSKVLIKNILVNPVSRSVSTCYKSNSTKK
jgi:hypothetical protein